MQPNLEKPKTKKPSSHSGSIDGALLSFSPIEMRQNMHKNIVFETEKGERVNTAKSEERKYQEGYKLEKDELDEAKEPHVVPKESLDFKDAQDAPAEVQKLQV